MVKHPRLAAFFSLGLPVIFQNLVMSSLNLVDGLLVGQLGDTAIAGLAAANQVYFLLSFFLFGITGTLGAFLAQLWGRRDLGAAAGLMRLSLGLTLGMSLIFALGSLFFSRTLLGFYTSDPAVVETGASYLVISAASFPLTALIFCLTTALRSCGRVKGPSAVNAASLVVNTVMSFWFIYGGGPLPPLGVQGAALGILLARGLETLGLVILLYQFPEFRLFRGSAPWSLVRTFLVKSLPVFSSTVCWATGMSVYNMVYGRIGTSALAAVNVASALESLAFVFFFGVSTACGLRVGESIGQGRKDEALSEASFYRRLNFASAVILGAGMFFLRDLFVTFYRISPETQELALRVLGITALGLWIKTGNMLHTNGILRAGGDMHFTLWLDLASLWALGLPLIILAALVWSWPLEGVMLLVVGEELVRYLAGSWRIRSQSWIQDLTGKEEEGAVQ